MEQQKNRPLTHQEIKDLPISRGGLPSYQHEFPNNAQRRKEARSKPGVYVSNNRKQTPARRYQFADVMMDTQKFGKKLKIPTGYVRKITHSIQFKLDRFYGAISEKVVGRKDSTKDKKNED